MSMVEIECAGEALQLFAEKAVYWPRARMLIVADVHLGKPAAFRQSGLAVPELTTAEDLRRLDALLELTGGNTLAILGDLFHDKDGMQPEMLETVTDWRERRTDLEILLVAGNHDQHSGPPPEHWKIALHATEYETGPFTFTHAPRVKAGRYGLSGHLHPAIVLRERYGPGMRLRCYSFGKDYGILPAFGSFTGMSNLEPVAGDRIFATHARENQVIEICGRKRRD